MDSTKIITPEFFELLKEALAKVAYNEFKTTKDIPVITGNIMIDVVIEGRNKLFENLSREWWNEAARVMLEEITEGGE